MKTVILSDLHLGNGGPYDIFAGAEALPALLDALAAAGPCRVVLNGDTADFLMNEDPLELDEQRAVAQARAIVAANGPVFAALGRLLDAGGALDVRVGNHDVELGLTAVQDVFRAALPAGRLRFELGDSPSFYEHGGRTALVVHGEHADPGNRFDHEALLGGDFTYPAGSVLVKRILNPLKHRYGLRFMDLLKPDFRGAVLAALAIAPEATRVLLSTAAVHIAWRWIATAFAGRPFAEDAEAPADPLSVALTDAVAEAGLDADELAAFVALEGPAAFADGDVRFADRLRSARVKLLRAGLRAYAAGHRLVAGHPGEAYFDLDPERGERKEARRLGEKYGARVVVVGHTHAARWHDGGEVLYVNSGTWIWQVRLPAADADTAEWAAWLDELDANPGLRPDRSERVRLASRFTAVTLEDAPEGGAAVALVEWRDGALHTLASATV